MASNALFSAQGFLPASFGMVIVAVSFGVILAVLTYAFAKVSGAHLNPAVSLAMLVTKKLSVKDFFGYIVSQFAGGIAGAALLIVLLGGRTSLGANGYGSLSTFGITLWLALLVEIIASFFFVYAVLAAKERDSESGSGALISGLALTAVYLFAVPFTGGSANPARSFGPALLQGGDALFQVWVFIAAPLAGALLASLLYAFLNGGGEKTEADEEEDGDTETEAAIAEDTEEQEVMADAEELDDQVDDTEEDRVN